MLQSSMILLTSIFSPHHFHPHLGRQDCDNQHGNQSRPTFETPAVFLSLYYFHATVTFFLPFLTILFWRKYIQPYSLFGMAAAQSVKFYSKYIFFVVVCFVLKICNFTFSLESATVSTLLYYFSRLVQQQSATKV